MDKETEEEMYRRYLADMSGYYAEEILKDETAGNVEIKIKSDGETINSDIVGSVSATIKALADFIFVIAKRTNIEPEIIAGAICAIVVMINESDNKDGEVVENDNKAPKDTLPKEVDKSLWY